MIWIVLVLAVLCIAMSCVALWYREKWQKAKETYVNMGELYYKKKKEYNEERDERKRLSNSISALNIEVDAAKERLKQSELLYDLSCKESDDKSKRIVALLGEVEQLRQQLPKRDSKGRFCKK